MAIDVFIVECASDLQGVDLERVRYDVWAYLRTQDVLGEIHEPIVAANGADARAAMSEFSRWASMRPAENLVILWFSMHGKRPPQPGLMGTSGQIGVAEVEWYEVLATCVGNWHPNTIIIVDVCWGASPTFPRAAGPGPKFIFGPTREGRRVELSAAANLVIGRAGKDGEFPQSDAFGIVDALNLSFSPNDEMKVPFYRVWWWGDEGKWRRYPERAS